MHIRCSSCHGAVWVELPTEKNQAAAACCKTCGQEYEFPSGRGPARVGKTLARDARQLAEERGVDLAGAYSVVLGTMTIEDVERVRAAPAPVAAAPRAAGTAFEADQDGLRYDPAFESAVRDGLLTSREAIQRGQRSMYAGMLAKRYRMTLETAYDVADNRISLLGAIRRNPQSETLPLELSLKKKNAWPLYGAIAATALVAILAVTFRPAAVVATVGRGATHTVGQAEIKTDGEGRILSVSALDPHSVLDAYCVADARRRFEPLGLTTPAEAVAGLRLGMMKRLLGSKEFLVIEIREDQKAGRWLAGDGVNPLVAAVAPPGAAAGIQPRNSTTPANFEAPRASLTNAEGRKKAPEATR
jgi:hypothetical protein